MPESILFIRLDKIGDLVCTLCSDDHPGLNEYSKHWLITKGLEFIPSHSVPKRKYSTLTKDWQGFKDLYVILKTKPFIASVSFQCPWWVHFLLFFFRIPIRVGVLSQWHSFLFLNTGLRQKRSRAEAHEADYNFALVELLVQKLKPNPSVAKSPRPPTPILILQADDHEPLLRKWRLTPGCYFIIHPGMAGSALNWPQQNYINFINLFHSEFPDIQIVITGTPADSDYLNAIVSTFKSKDYFINLQSQLNSEELLSLISASRGVLAPSTGVLHLAASLGVPTFGIFSPLTVQRPTRWGPRGRFTRTYVPRDDQQSSLAMAELEIFSQFKDEFRKTLP